MGRRDAATTEATSGGARPTRTRVVAYHGWQMDRLTRLAGADPNDPRAVGGAPPVLAGGASRLQLIRVSVEAKNMAWLTAERTCSSV